jgi:hypothetical protein
LKKYSSHSCNLFLSSLLILSSLVKGQGFGEFASAVFLLNCNSNVYYNTTGSGQNCINPDCSQQFNGFNFGSFNQNSQSLLLKGGEIKTWKGGSNGNVCSGRLNYVVYTQGNRPASPVFSTINLPFKSNCCGSVFCDNAGPCSGNDQKWSESGVTIDLTSRPTGNYSLEVYFDYSGDDNTTFGCGTTKYISNSGFNYVANFQIVASGSNCWLLLPITIANVESKCEEKISEISWDTYSEENSSHFIVESSVDGLTWMQNCKLDAAGTTAVVKHYTCAFENFSHKIFRITEYALSGETHFYGPYELQCEQNNETKIWQSNYDFTGFHVSTKYKREGSMELIDMNGKLVWRTGLRTFETPEKIMLPFSLSNGTYFVALRDNRGQILARNRIYFAP